MIKHVVRCDAPDCAVEAGLHYQGHRYNGGLGGGPGGLFTTAYAVPDSWQEVQGKHFCSYACLGRWAEAQSHVEAKE